MMREYVTKLLDTSNAISCSQIIVYGGLYADGNASTVDGDGDGDDVEID